MYPDRVSQPALPSPWFDFHLPAVVLAAGSCLLFCCWRCCLMGSSAPSLRGLLLSSEATFTTMDMVMERLLPPGTHHSPLLLPMLISFSRQRCPGLLRPPWHKLTAQKVGRDVHPSSEQDRSHGILAGVSGPGQTSLGAHKDPGQPAAGIQRRQWKQIGNKTGLFIFYSTRVGCEWQETKPPALASGMCMGTGAPVPRHPFLKAAAAPEQSSWAPGGQPWGL